MDIAPPVLFQLQANRWNMAGKSFSGKLLPIMKTKIEIEERSTRPSFHRVYFHGTAANAYAYRRQPRPIRLIIGNKKLYVVDPATPDAE